ncbi:MAG: hypothetical protein ACYDEV_01040 [Acidiferrobacter sp.]
MAAGKGTITVLASAVVCVAVIFGALRWEDNVALPTGAGQVVGGVHHFTIDEFNYYYKPSKIQWHVGEKVEVTLVNRSQSAPSIPHQFAIGRTLVTRSNGFPKSQALAVGWKQNFFDGVPITSGGQTGPIPAFSVSLNGGQSFSFSFVVPNKLGKWNYACFLQTGQHYMNGMHGTIDVLPAHGS